MKNFSSWGPIRGLLQKISLFKSVPRQLKTLQDENRRIIREIEDLKVMVACSDLRHQRDQMISRLEASEMRVFSQFGDDGIIQFLVRDTNPRVKKFIEFGVEDYTEANTRFLLRKDNWSGLVIDSSQDNVSRIVSDHNYWRHDLQAICASVNCNNVNEIFAQQGFSGEIGILSIDIDGNDYWVWEATTIVDPMIVVVEFNSVFGAKLKLSVPYRPDFFRTESHYSNLYWGCSLNALCSLADKKGYDFVGCNSAGNNAYFVKKGKTSLPALNSDEGFVTSKFRESRDLVGRLTFLAGEERLLAIAHLDVYDFDYCGVRKLKDVMSFL